MAEKEVDFDDRVAMIIAEHKALVDELKGHGAALSAEHNVATKALKNTLADVEREFKNKCSPGSPIGKRYVKKLCSNLGPSFNGDSPHTVESARRASADSDVFGRVDVEEVDDEAELCVRRIEFEPDQSDEYEPEATESAGLSMRCDLIIPNIDFSKSTPQMAEARQMLETVAQCYLHLGVCMIGIEIYNFITQGDCDGL